MRILLLFMMSCLPLMVTAKDCPASSEEEFKKALSDKTCSDIEVKMEVLDFTNITDKDMALIKEKTITAPAVNITETSLTKLEIKNIYSGKFEIRRNLQLQEIKFEQMAKTKDDPVFDYIISGNPLLTITEELKSAIKNTKKENQEGLHLQEEGECEFTDVVKNVNDLSVCKSVFGALKMEKTTGSKVVNKLTNITGCLSIIDTELEDIDFLKETIFGKCDSPQEIRGNKKLWIHPWHRKKLPNTKIELHEEAVGKCSTDEAVSEDFDCVLVLGNLKISETANLHNLKSIRMVKGQIEVEGNLENILEFPELVNISTSKSPVLLFTKNSELTTIVMPKLSYVETSGGAKFTIFLKENPKLLNFKLIRTKYMENYIQRIAAENPGLPPATEYDGKEIEIVCVFGSLEISDLALIDGCDTITGDLVLTNAQQKQITPIAEITGCLTIKNTGLKDLSFLKLSKESSLCSSGVVITGNEGLCLRLSDVKEFSKSYFKSHFKYEPDLEKCELPCVQHQYVEQHCNQIEGNLTIEHQQGDLSGGALKAILGSVKRVRGALTIRHNKDVEVNLPKLEVIGSGPEHWDPKAHSGKEKYVDNIQAGIVIYGNKNFKGITFGSLTIIKSYLNPAVFVKDYLMSKDETGYLKDRIYGREIQKECDFSNIPVRDRAELEFCAWIKGDLILNGTTGMPNQIEDVSGCISAINTDMSNMNFKAFAKNYKTTCKSGGRPKISGNKNFCDRWSSIQQLLKTTDVEITDNCRQDCVEAEFLDPKSFCKALDGSLTITKETKVERLKVLLDRVVRVKDIVHMEGTTLAEISFSKLEDIENQKKAAQALVVVQNHELRSFDIPNIRSINGEGRITSNRGFRLDVEVHKKLAAAAGRNGKDVTFACSETQYTSFEQMNRTNCPRFSEDFVLRGEIEGTPVPIGIIDGCLQIDGTSLDSLDFINFNEINGQQCNGQSYIRNNPNLCIHPDTLKVLKAKYKTFENPSGNKGRDECPLTCTIRTGNGVLPYDDCDHVIGWIAFEDDCSPNEKYKRIKSVTGGIWIKRCTLNSWKTILPQLKKVHTGYEGSNHVCIAMENVKGYSNVTDLMELEMTSVFDKKPFIMLTVAEPIHYMDIAYLQYHFGVYSVEVSNMVPKPEGVCVHPGPPFHVIENCHTVEGDLVLSDITIDVPLTVKEITGCFILNQTNMASYEFLTNIEKVGEKCRWNDQYTDVVKTSCIPYDIRKRTSGRVAELMGKKESWNECHECVGKLEMGRMCTLFIGDLEINQNFDLETMELLVDVERVVGRLIVRNSPLQAVPLFKLKEIEASESEGPAIEITGNEELAAILIPHLNYMNISSTGTQIIKIADNAKLMKSERLVKKLQDVGVECAEENGEQCHFAQVKGAAENLKKPKKKEKEEEKKEKKTEEKQGSSASAVVAAVCITLGLVLLIGGGVAVGLGVFFLKKGSSNKGKPNVKIGKAKVTIGKGKPPTGLAPKKSSTTVANGSKPTTEKEKQGDQAVAPGGAPADENAPPV